MLRLERSSFNGSDVPSFWIFDDHTRTKDPSCSSFDFFARILSYATMAMGSCKLEILPFASIVADITTICIQINADWSSLRSSRFLVLRKTCCTAVPIAPPKNAAGCWCWWGHGTISKLLLDSLDILLVSDRIQCFDCDTWWSLICLDRSRIESWHMGQ